MLKNLFRQLSTYSFLKIIRNINCHSNSIDVIKHFPEDYTLWVLEYCANKCTSKKEVERKQLLKKKERKRKHFKTCIVCSKPNGVLPNRLKHDFISLFCNVHCSRESLHRV